MTPSSFAPNLADSGGASEDTHPRPRPPTSGNRLPVPRSARSPIRGTVTPEPLIPLIPARSLRGRAFTLIELLAVIAIIAIVSVAAVPVMRGLGGSQSSRATAQSLVSALEQTRTAAILSGGNAYLVLPDSGTTTISATNQFRSYAIVRQTVDLDADSKDDFQTGVAAPGWVLLSKWERLPGDLLFGSNLLTQKLIQRITPTGIPFPANALASSLPAIGFTPSGGLTDASGTNGLLFASSNKVTNGRALVADRIEIAQFSGRVRYVGILTNTNF